ncbi:MAG TPA: hypothetical protein VM529_04105 [Gemmata sp.]|nr:hypothetical protein [Gemmata sp.]
MAATHLTLEEAADRLGISPEDFKKRLKTHPAFKNLVPIRDGSNLRFKEAAIEELARELGAGSNPENPLPTSSRKAGDEPLKFAEEDDVFSLAADEPKAGPKKGSDSDIRLDADKPKSGKIAKNAGGEAVPTEEISIDFSGPGSAVIKGGSSSKLSAPKSSGKLTSDSGKGLSKPGSGDSSEFELSLDADSDDFELKLNTDTSDEVALGEMPSEKDVTGSGGRRGGESGILARNPADSGISLEKGKDDSSGAGKIDSDSDLDFELTLDSSSAISASKLGNLKPKKEDSDSEFELTLDDSSGGADLEAGDGDSDKGDIFETDFEIPPMGDSESGSEAVALESSDTDLEAADFDVAADDGTEVTPESGSEVVLLEEEDDAPKARKGKPARKKAADEDVDLADVEEEDEEESSVSKALKGARGRDEDEVEEEAAVPAGAYRPVPWGPVPVIFLLPAFLLMMVGAIMSYEVVKTMTGYQQPKKPAAPLVRGVADALGMEPAGQ